MSTHLAGDADLPETGKNLLQLSFAQGAGDARLANGTTVGAYVIEEEIGSGSMGNVYRARHQRLGRQVALKVVRTELLGMPSLVQRFLQEGRAVNQINHEHIVEVHDYVEERDPARVYCVMEHLQGQSLTQRLAQRPSTLESIRSMAQQLASALGASHAAGVVHRDLKPDNIFLVSRHGRDDWVKVLDFGVAKCVQPMGQEDLIHTDSGTVMGTPRYMAPEQMAGLEVDARADIYALGTILYELVTGKPPLDCASFGQLAAAIIKEPPPPLPICTAGHEPLPAHLGALIMACLSKQPEDRPPSMAAVEAALAGPPLLLTRRVRKPSRTPWLILSALSLTMLLMFWAEPRQAKVAPTSGPPTSIAPQPPPAEVTLRVETRPPGALVWREDSGEALGRTPLEVKLTRAGKNLRLHIELEGYVPLERQLSNESSQRLELTLRALRKTATRFSTRGLTRGVLDPY